MDFKHIFFSTIFLIVMHNCVLSEDERRYITFIDENNSTRVIDLKDKPDLKLLQRSLKQGDRNKYLLFTRKNPSSAYSLNSTSISESSNYTPEVPTVVVVHGWDSDQNSGINTMIRQVYLSKSDVNLIVVDWSYLAKSNYVTATLGVPSVGQALGRFLNTLHNKTGMSYDDIHLIGFSLGAHVVGIAGRQLDGQVARITGLDPAGPLWNTNTNRLKSTDALYVEGIHTNQLLFGTTRTVGDTDFYPNGGMKQPGCQIATDACSHNRAWQLFASTVQYNKLVGHKCSGLLWMKSDLCYGDSLNMGNDDLRKTGSGLYRLNTKATYPYY